MHEAIYNAQGRARSISENKDDTRDLLRFSYDVLFRGNCTRCISTSSDTRKQSPQQATTSPRSSPFLRHGERRLWDRFRFVLLMPRHLPQEAHVLPGHPAEARSVQQDAWYNGEAAYITGGVIIIVRASLRNVINASRLRRPWGLVRQPLRIKWQRY